MRSYRLTRLILRDCHWVTREAVEYHALKQGVPGPGSLAGLGAGLRVGTGAWLGLGEGPGLRVGHITPCPGPPPPPQHCLATVDLTGCWELGDPVLLTLLQRFPRLTSVALGNIYSVTDRVMAGLAAHTPLLTHLDIRHQASTI